MNIIMRTKSGMAKATMVRIPLCYRLVSECLKDDPRNQFYGPSLPWSLYSEPRCIWTPYNSLCTLHLIPYYFYICSDYQIISLASLALTQSITIL